MKAAPDDMMTRWMEAGERLRRLDPARFELMTLEGLLSSVDENGIPVAGRSTIAAVAAFTDRVFSKGEYGSAAYLVTEIVEVATPIEELPRYLDALVAAATPSVIAHLVECARRELKMVAEYLAANGIHPELAARMGGAA